MDVGLQGMNVEGRAADLAVEVHGHTVSSARNGVTGKNEHTQGVPTPNAKGATVGNGVFGLSMIADGSGVRGFNRASIGFAYDPNGNAIVDDVNGYFAAGVTGESERGVGVVGVGGVYAGYFVGDVVVDGTLSVFRGLTVQGRDIAAALEDLRERLTILEAKQAGGQPARVSTERPVITKAEYNKDKDGGTIMVTAERLLKNVKVYVRIVSKTNPQVYSVNPAFSSDSQGKVDALPVLFRPPYPDVWFVSVQDGRPDSHAVDNTLWSDAYPVQAA